MNYKKIIRFAAFVLLTCGVVGLISAFQGPEEKPQTCCGSPGQHVNLAISHGHCNLNFYGKTGDLNLYFNEDDQEDFKVSFSVNTTSLNVYGDNDDLTLGLRTEKMFDASGNNTIEFRTEDIFVLGEDWFQMRGKMIIKGVEKSVRLMATPAPKSVEGHTWILEEKVNLDDFGIHSDLPEHAPNSEMGEHMMFLNMKVTRKVSDPNLEGC